MNPFTPSVAPQARSRGAWLLCALALATGCSKKAAATGPADAGAFVIPDAGPPPACTIGCHGPADAGTDAGYQPGPLTITSVTPGRGPVTGGTSVQLSGKGFMLSFADRASEAPKQSTLLVGGNPATDYRVISDEVAEFTAPPGQAGATDVVLTNPNGTIRCNGCFTYFAPVLLQSVSPASGPVAGGTVVTLAGKGLTADTRVLFGDKPAGGVGYDATSGALTAAAPPGEQPGAVDVRVFNAVGTSSLRRAFRYTGPPRLAGSDPAGGPTAGGTAVTLTGSGLAEVSACSFGGVAAAQVLVEDDGAVQAIAPASGVEGPVDLACTSPYGTATLRRAFVYYDPGRTDPRVLGVSPTHGPAAGGNRVTLVGVGLAGLSVTLGGQPATVLSASDHLLTVAAPAGPAHTAVDVAAGGTTLSAAYTYNLALQAVSPTHGPQAGGTALSLQGAGLRGRLALSIGGVAATGVQAQSEALLAAVAPAGVGGAARVRLWDQDDPEDYAELAHGYVYDEDLAVGAVVPGQGAIAGGTFVTVYGAGFAEGVVVRFGDKRAKDLTVLDSHTLTCHTPVGEVGVVDVSAELGGRAATAPQAYSYFDPTNQGGGSSGGPLDGTLNVTVLDSTFTQYGAPVAGATVMLGLDPSTPFQGQTDARGQITFSDPAIVKAQTVSVFKTGYEMFSVVEQGSQNLTVYIGQNDGSGGSPGGGGDGPQVVTITGKVRGFKPPAPLQPGTHEEARVFVAPHSLFYVEPLGYTYPPSPAERTVLNQDGQSYLRAVLPGLYAVYAVYGIVDDATGLFTPVLMGIRRGIEVNATHPANNMDLVLDMHLDWSAPISILNPLTDPASGTPITNQVYAYLDLGAEGVIPLGGTTSLTPDLLYPGLPELDGSNLIFLNYATAGGYYPMSVFFRRQPGDPRQGLTLGPMLGLVRIDTPSEADPTFTGTLGWTFGSGPPPDLTQVSIQKVTPFGAISLWSLVVPGADTQVSLPPTVLQSLLDREPPGEMLSVQITSDRAPRFDYNHWSYGDLSTLDWTSFTQNAGVLQLPQAGTP